MPEETQTAATPLDLVLEADREIACVGAGDPYPFYELLHRIAGRIAPVEAFYICLYSEAEQNLFFPYNYDLDIYDPPLTVPMGDGPTSCVIRRKEPFVWNCLEDQARLHLGGFRFGDTSVCTQSAVHLPIHAPGAAPDAPLLGVLSAQCYTPHAYDALALRLFQWLADRAGRAMAMANEQAASLAAERQRHATALADQFVQMTNHITQMAQAVSALVPPDAPALRQAVADLLRACYRSQTEANQLPLRLDRLPPPAPPVPAPPIAFTERESEIIPLLAAGHTNAEIARRLCIASDTIKYHLKHIYGKLGVKNRQQASQILNSARDHS